MTRDQFQKLVLMQLRQVMPELPTWEDAIRYLRLTGESMESFDNLGSYESLIDHQMAESFRRYGDLSWHSYHDEQVRVPAGQSELRIVSYVSGVGLTHVFDPDRIWQGSRILTRIDTPAQIPQGGSGLWGYAVLSDRVRLYNPPDQDVTLRIVGYGYPYFEVMGASPAPTDLLMGVRAGTEYALARHVMSYMLDSVDPKSSQAIRSEIETGWLMDKQRNAWERLRRSRASHGERVDPWLMTRPLP